MSLGSFDQYLEEDDANEPAARHLPLPPTSLHESISKPNAFNNGDSTKSIQWRVDRWLSASTFMDPYLPGLHRGQLINHLFDQLNKLENSLGQINS